MQKKSTAKIPRPIAANPAITPPTIAPIGADFFVVPLELFVDPATVGAAPLDDDMEENPAPLLSPLLVAAKMGSVLVPADATSVSYIFLHDFEAWPAYVVEKGAKLEE
jgi:hypothetical protein